MTAEVFGSGAYLVIKADGLAELADKVDEHIQKGYAPHGSMVVLAGVNLKPTEYVQTVYKASRGG